MRPKAPKQQLLFSTKTECALWVLLPEASRARIVSQYARLVARVAKAATPRRPIGEREDEQ